MDKIQTIHREGKKVTVTTFGHVMKLNEFPTEIEAAIFCDQFSEMMKKDGIPS